MDETNSVIQKVTDILMWDVISKSQLYYTVDFDKSVVSSHTTGEKIVGLKTTYLIDNRCGKAGLVEVVKILSAIEWETIAAVFVITNDFRMLKKVDTFVSHQTRSQGDLYGIDPGYYFSLVPLSSPNNKNIENYIVSLKSRPTLIAKLKYLIKRSLISTNYSRSLYEQYLYCSYGRV